MEVELQVTEKEETAKPLRRPGSVALAAGGARPGGTTGSLRNPAHPAWSVADENQVSEGSSQPKRLSHHGDKGLAQ